MFSNKRKTIGVFICRGARYFQKTLCEGILKQASKLGYNVAIFSSFGEYGESQDFGNGESLIASLPPYEELDGVILALDTIDVACLKEQIIYSVKKRCRGPVVCIREGIEGFYNFIINENSCMESIIRHFVEFHKFRDICFLTGPKDKESSQARLNCFINIMKENGLDVKEKQVFFGQYWKFDGEEACRHFLDEREDLPDAILCANDYMAISVCNELIRRGIRIPEDVAVGGYDGIWETKVSAPSISTVAVPFYEMGTEAVNCIEYVCRGRSVPKETVFNVKLKLQESCGCVKVDSFELLKNRKKLYSLLDEHENFQNQAAFMTIDLEELDTMRELIPIVEKYIPALGDYKAFHLCLCEGVHENQEKEVNEYTERMRLYMSKWNGKPVEAKDIFFQKKELLPENITGDECQNYYFLPLHFKKRCFGYTAISFYDYKSYSRVYQNWMVNLGNAIEDIFTRRKMQHLIDDLEDMYVRDVLTGLFNRRGFDKYGDELLKKAKSHGLNVYALAMDLDGLKRINDTYGHAQGDIALRMVAESISVAAKHGEVCARVGGDEFNIFGICKNDGYEQAKRFVRDFQKNLIHTNKKMKNYYKVDASFGIYSSRPEADDTLEVYTNLSDRFMYRLKEKRKTNCD